MIKTDNIIECYIFNYEVPAVHTTNSINFMRHVSLEFIISTVLAPLDLGYYVPRGKLSGLTSSLKNSYAPVTLSK